jgi:hypothetical protein
MHSFFLAFLGSSSWLVIFFVSLLIGLKHLLSLLGRLFLLLLLLVFGIFLGLQLLSILFLIMDLIIYQVVQGDHRLD